jgi:hypothetical protein
MRGGGDKLHDKAEHLGASENARSAPPALTSGPTRVQAIVERGHHAEVPPTAAQPPQQVGVPSALAATRAVGGHHLRRNKVVAARAMLARDPGLSKCLGLVRWLELDAREDLLCSLRPGRHGHRLIVGSRSAQQVATTLPIAGVVAL